MPEATASRPAADSTQTALRGVGASSGVAVGRLLVLGAVRPAVPEPPDPGAAFTAALDEVAASLRSLAEAARQADRQEAAEVLDAQALMADDPLLRDAVTGRLDAGRTLDRALDEAADEIATMLATVDDPYIAARADDVREVADRVRRHLAGVAEPDLSAVTEPTILVATTITAAETSQLDPAVVLGFATETGGPTSHVAIIARSLGVPAVVGVSGLTAAAADRVDAALDGSTGEVVIDPDPATRADFEARRDAHLAAREAARAFRGKRVGVGDREVAVAANVGGTADLERAVDVAADGIGLFRTEFLFLDRDEAPTEEEQADIYRRAAAAFDQPVVIRTFDIGGDKPAPYLTAPTDEENPFLGVRGARLYPRERDLFADQVRAIVRATETGDPWLMLPMVSTLDEIRELMAVVDEIAADLIAREPGLRRPPVGVMVEVPSIALVADAVAEHVDFFSIGTNDLTQYTFAADRTNGALDHLQDPLHPAVLALCTFTRAAARRRGVSVSVCGLAAADPAGAALFAGMGIDKLSVAAASVNPIKATLSGLDPDRLGELVERCLAASSAAEVRALVGEVLESV